MQVNLPFEVWYRCLSAVLMPFGGMQQGLWFNVETAFGVKEPGVERRPVAPRWRGRRSTPAFRAGSEYWQQKVIFSSWLSLCVRWSKICVFRVPVWTPGRSRIGRVDGRAGARREACCTLRLRNTITHEKRSKLKIVLLRIQPLLTV